MKHRIWKRTSNRVCVQTRGNSRGPAIAGMGLVALVLAGCSPADAVTGEHTTKADAAPGAGSLVYIHCVGQLASRSPVTGDVSVRSLTADYAIDDSNKRILEYSVERQVMQPLGKSDQCSTTVTDKIGQVQCQASQPRSYGGIEIVSTDTRLDRVLGKMTFNVRVQKSYREGGELNSVTAFSAEANCTPGVDPTTIRKF